MMSFAYIVTGDETSQIQRRPHIYTFMKNQKYISRGGNYIHLDITKENLI